MMLVRDGLDGWKNRPRHECFVLSQSQSANPSSAPAWSTEYSVFVFLPDRPPNQTVGDSVR